MLRGGGARGALLPGFGGGDGGSGGGYGLGGARQRGLLRSGGSGRRGVLRAAHACACGVGVAAALLLLLTWQRATLDAGEPLPWRADAAAAGGGFRDGFVPDAVASAAALPVTDDDDDATVLDRLAAVIEMQQRTAQEVAMLADLVKSLALGGADGAEGAASRVARARAAGGASEAPPQKWSYAASSGGWSGGARGTPTVPDPPPAPPAPPSRFASLRNPPHAALPLRPDRDGAAAAGGAAALSHWANVSADPSRRDAVRDAMRHAWSSYAAIAFGYDELQPVAKRGKNGFGGMGATIVDAIDTLFIMGLQEEYSAAREWIQSSLSFDRAFDASVFETTIRIIGGLLSANHLSGDAMFADKAKELADRLLPAFDTPTGIPYSTVNLRTGRTRNAAWTQSASPLAEFGTTQLEFSALSDATGDPSYGERSEGVIRMLMEASNRMTGPASGLFPLYLNPTTNTFTSHKVSFGAMGDSFYEYLLKMWLIGGRTPALAPYRRMWEDAMESMIATLVHRSTPGGWTYITELDRGMQVHKMDHLACFVPGMLVLGAQGDVAERYVALAKDLSDTCVQMYAGTATGLSPELVNFRDGRDMFTNDRSAHNLLRPEAVESLFYLYRKTGEEVYREQGWAIFTAFEAHCRLRGGYAGVRDVRALPARNDDTQQSFFLAETLKYLYLLYSDSNTINLDEWVFNTEAHPLRVTTRDTSLLAEADSDDAIGDGDADFTEDELALLAEAELDGGDDVADDVAGEEEGTGGSVWGRRRRRRG